MINKDAGWTRCLCAKCDLSISCVRYGALKINQDGSWKGVNEVKNSDRESRVKGGGKESPSTTPSSITLYTSISILYMNIYYEHLYIYVFVHIWHPMFLLLPFQTYCLYTSLYTALLNTIPKETSVVTLIYIVPIGMRV